MLVLVSAVDGSFPCQAREGARRGRRSGPLGTPMRHGDEDVSTLDVLHVSVDNSCPFLCILCSVLSLSLIELNYRIKYVSGHVDYFRVMTYCIHRVGDGEKRPICPDICFLAR